MSNLKPEMSATTSGTSTSEFKTTITGVIFSAIVALGAALAPHWVVTTSERGWIMGASGVAAAGLLALYGAMRSWLKVEVVRATSDLEKFGIPSWMLDAIETTIEKDLGITPTPKNVVLEWTPGINGGGYGTTTTTGDTNITITSLAPRSFNSPLPPSAPIAERPTIS